ncbi:MAG: GxxExxY protein [Verrucomicrobia bacterium]|nr:GxxExxY protein [Verrucomicrobiota bacterium]
MEHGDVTEQIIGCAYRVHNTMGFGFLESVYENCMLVELRKTDLEVEQQAPIRVKYDDTVVGDFMADLVVEDCVVVELKSVRQLVKAHEAQLVNYLVATGKPVGLLINFGERGVEVRRKVRELPEAHRRKPAEEKKNS